LSARGVAIEGQQRGVWCEVGISIEARGVALGKYSRRDWFGEDARGVASRCHQGRVNRERGWSISAARGVARRG